MKHSPFEFFRKHQRVGMVILTVLAMFAFVFLDQTFQGGGGARASQTAVKFKGGKLTHDDLGQLIAQRVAANRFIQATAEAIMEDYPKDQEAQMIARGLVMQQFGQDFPGQPESETNVMYSHLMRLEAKRLGMSVNDYTVEAYIGRMLRNRVSQDRYREILKTIKLSEKHLYDVFREEILSRMGATALAPRVSQTPEQYWEYYKRLKVQQNLEIAALPVSAFAKSIPEPSARELEAFFNEYKTRYAYDAPDYWKPGFRQPTKVRIQYLTAPYLDIEAKVESGKDKYTKPITDKDVVEYYEKNKDTLYRELEIDDPLDETKNDDAKKSDANPLGPLITPEKPGTPEATKPEGSKPEAKPETPAGDKPTEKPAETPATDKPATEKPATEKPAEPKAEEKPEAKPEAKPEVKPEETSDKKPCGEDPATPEKSATENAPEAKATEEKPAEEKPATEKAPVVKPEAESKPADAKPADEKPATEKPAEGDKPADEAKPADETKKDETGKKDENGKEVKAEIKPPKYKPLTDELKTQIQESLVQAQAMESLKKLGEDAKAQLETDQIKFAYGPSASGNTVFIDFNENGTVDEDEPAVESDEKIDASDLTKVPTEVMDALNAKLFETTKAYMTKVGDKLGLQYAETDLFALRDFDSNPNLKTLGKVVDVNDNPFQPNEAGKIRQALFGAESRFHVHVGKDDETRLYVYWKVEHVKEHIAKFTDKGIKEEVLEAWKLLKAYPEAQKRAEELVQAAKGKKDLREAFKGKKVTEDASALDLEVNETGDFTWMSTGVPSPQMMQASRVTLSHVEWTDDKIDEEFMRVACEDLAEGEIGFAPNRDHSVIFVIRVVSRATKTGEDMAKLQETFMKEQLFDNFPAGIDPSLRQYFPPPAYAQMADLERSRLYFDWLESLKNEYQVTWTDELKNY